MSEVSKVLRYM